MKMVLEEKGGLRKWWICFFSLFMGGSFHILQGVNTSWFKLPQSDALVYGLIGSGLSYIGINLWQGRTNGKNKEVQ